jgi:hypothetical protein
MTPIPKELLPYLHLIISIGAGVVVSIVGGFLIGLWLDRWLGWQGVGSIAGIGIGVVVGFVWLYRKVTDITNDSF